MDKSPEFRLFHIPIWSIPIMFGGGFLIMSFIDISFLSSLRGIGSVSLIVIILGPIMLKGYEFIEYKLEDKISWLESPLKRMLYTIILQLAFLCSVLSIFVLVMSLFQGALPWHEFLKVFTTGAIPGIIFSVVGTFFANTILFFQNWKNAAVREESLKNEKLALEYEALKGQLNPHFLFNSFTALSSLVFKNQDKAVEYIRHLSNVYRYVLDSKDKDIVPLEHEIEFVESVAYLYSIRHEDDLIINIDLKPLVNEFVVPVSLQMLLENAIKHNIISSSKPLRVDIIRGEEGCIVVRNNLQQRESTLPSNGIGLNNINSRFKLLANKSLLVTRTENYFEVRIPVILVNA